MYDQGTMILRFHTGAQYLQIYVPRKFGGGCRIVDLRERQDMSQRMNALHSGALGRIVQYYYGETSFECAGGKRGYYLAATLRSDPGTGLVIWNVPVLGGFVANADKFSTGMEAMRHMQQTWQTNPAWLGRESATNMRIAQISRQAGQEMSDMISQSYWNRQRTLDDVSRKRSIATLNYADVVDPATGETWKVEGGHNYYWRRNATNEIVGSQTYNRPDIDFSPLAE